MKKIRIARWESEVGECDAIPFLGRGEFTLVGLCAGNRAGFVAPGSGRADEIGSVHTNVPVNRGYADGPGAFSGLGLVGLARLFEEGERGWVSTYPVLETGWNAEAALGESAAGVSCQRMYARMRWSVAFVVRR